ncbi:RNA polymerase sigma factor [Actinokineospora auranticolor]|uniref:RNA polymerase sigma factor (Sigma-70 family) n=1 Tax=Actinokineospora auranticolor TaxID=155976 RepID=A0A2S6GJU4_9PSEU|nr:RNA polymerase sigma factor [Actinokineospora auranticolor]PPK65460.1 RNA polymerase sigma factor (sigma-70 family) [Actinokineospora auranticolor]
MGSADAAVAAVWRVESARLVAGLARLTGDVGLAEELAQDALVAALEQWPVGGVPPNPAGWLMTTAKRRAIDRHRRDRSFRDKLAVLAGAEDEDPMTAVDDRLDDHIGDDLLRLVFTACHPALAVPARIALVLRAVGGLTTAEIARAYQVPESTVAQRIVRAKRALAGVGFELPLAAEFDARLGSVLEVVYLVFNEGYVATSGPAWARPELCREAMRLGRVVAGLAPAAPEAHGLVALMELQASRLAARVDAAGRPVLLADQDRRRWDRLLIRHGLAALDRAVSLGVPVGPYTVQAAIAACHARAVSVAETNWPEIVSHYDALVAVWPSPVVKLNRAVAVGMASGPAAGLALVDGLVERGVLAGNAQIPAVRGEFLDRLGRREEAAAEFHRAASLTTNEAERSVFLRRA